MGSRVVEPEFVASTNELSSSESRNLEQHLSTTLRELRDVKAALDEHSIVAITNPAGKITYVNDKFCAISKYSREELLGQDHRIINSRYHPSEFFRDLWQTIGQGRVWHGEIKNRAKDGSYYWVDTTICPFVSDSGKPLQYVAIRTDITQRKADEAALQNLASELAEKNKELEAIVYTVSHDLRSPLVNVQGFGRQLQRACDAMGAAAAAAGENGSVPVARLKQPLEVTIPQDLRFINAGVSKMESLLAGLLRYSRLGRVALALRPLNMNGLLAEIIAAMKFQLDESKAEVLVEPLPTCIGDNVQTSQVFANLLDNALKYRNHARPLRISVSGMIQQGQAVYRVADNGIGIVPEHQSKVFDIFHRLNPDATSGEGLGLTIAQRVLERQKGRIWVESRPGEGSHFYVALPAIPERN
jgi:PAS domain S-box-containing protein